MDISPRRTIVPKNWADHKHPHKAGDGHGHWTHQPPDSSDLGAKRVALGNAIAAAATDNKKLIDLLADPVRVVDSEINQGQIKRLLFQDSWGGEGGANDHDVSLALLARVLALRENNPSDRDGLMCGCGG
jgi:hypothetical protein